MKLSTKLCLTATIVLETYQILQYIQQKQYFIAILSCIVGIFLFHIFLQPLFDCFHIAIALQCIILFLQFVSMHQFPSSLLSSFIILLAEQFFLPFLTWICMMHDHAIQT